MGQSAYRPWGFLGKPACVAGFFVRLEAIVYCAQQNKPYKPTTNVAPTKQTERGNRVGDRSLGHAPQALFRRSYTLRTETSQGRGDIWAFVVCKMLVDVINHAHGDVINHVQWTLAGAVVVTELSHLEPQ